MQVECQRCLSSMSEHLSCDSSLAVVWTDEEAATLPRYLDALVETETNSNLWELVEDELILAIPVVANHPESHCSATQFLRDRTKLAAEKKADNPFQILEQLKEQP